MNTCIALLRGINVSGKNLLKMTDLTASLSGKGLFNIRTYIQSGNLVFEAETTDSEKLASLVSLTIRDRFGLEIPVQVLLREELILIHDNNPFIRDGIPSVQLHLTLLQSEPDPGVMAGIIDRDFGIDGFIISGKAVYLNCPEGYGRTKLNNTFFENKLKTRATTRNWATIVKLCSM